MHRLLGRCFEHTILLLVLALVFVGCSGGGGGGGGAPPGPVTPPVAPNGLSYTTEDVIYALGTPITPNIPSLVVGQAASYAVAPALPAGLSIHPTSGEISGTPTVVTPAAIYEVTASNTSGQTSADLRITVVAPPPNDLGYTTPITYTVGLAITPNVPQSPAAAGVTYSVSPSLPTGLTLNPTSGVLTGTPQSALAQTEFTVQAGVRISVLVMELVLEAPNGLVYPTPLTFYDDVPIVAITPAIDGSPSTFTVTPALPAGLSFAATTGTISGTPTANKAAANYTVKATNLGGETTFVINITVAAPVVCDIEYFSPVTYLPDIAIGDSAPLIEGGCDLETWSITPALPSGLSFDTSTGLITGTPTDATARTEHTIRATGVDGYIGSTKLVLTIGDVYNYVLDDAQVEFATSTGLGAFSAPVIIEEDSGNAGFPHEIAGFQVGVAHDSSYLAITDLTEGSALAALNSGDGADFFGFTATDEGVILGVIVSINLTDALVADGPQEVAVIHYETNAATLDGTSATVRTKLEFVDTLGPDVDTDIPNVLSVGASSFPPVPYDATIELTPEP